MTSVAAPPAYPPPSHDPDQKVGLIDVDHQSPVADSPSHPPRAATNDPEGERKVRQIIQDNASKNVELLHEIETTHDAVFAVQNNEARLKKLDEELAVQSRATELASDETKIQLGKYTRSRDSFTRKWFYIITRMRDNLRKKVQEGEEAYNKALADQTQAEEREKKLKADKERIEQENSEVANQAKRHGEAHKEIDQLYAKIFDGLTPGFPDEDELEGNFRKRKEEHDATAATLKALNATAKASALLRSTTVRAQKENTKAKIELQTSFFSGNEYALTYIQRAAMLIEQAIDVCKKVHDEMPKPLDREFVSAIRTLEQHQVNAYNAAASTLANANVSTSSSSIFSTIQSIQDELTLATEAHAPVSKIINNNGNSCKEAIKITSRVMEDARQALQEIRQNAFEITVGHGSAAPPYHECCDRAEGFENDAHEECERMPDPVIDDSGLPPPPSYEKTVNEDEAAPAAAPATAPAAQATEST